MARVPHTIGPRLGELCPGTLSRRSFVRSGLVGLSSLGLADLLRIEAQARTNDYPLTSDKSLLVLWLWGGPSHMETFDLKPLAPSEYRGEFNPIATNVPGIEISEHLPRLARLADKFSLIRSCHHDSPGHVNSTHTMLTGYPGDLVETPPFRPKYPDVWAVANKLLGPRTADMPPHVVLPFMRYNGAAYLGNNLEPLVIKGDPNEPKFQVPNLSARPDDHPQLGRRMKLLEQVDRFRRAADTSGAMDSLDEFNRRAVSILTSDAVRQRSTSIKKTPPRATATDAIRSVSAVCSRADSSKLARASCRSTSRTSPAKRPSVGTITPAFGTSSPR